MSRPGPSDAFWWRKTVPKPWHCGQVYEQDDSDVGCGQLINDIGLGRLDGQVDHIDGDPYNRDISNRRLLHTICHAHHRGGPTKEQREAISAKLKGRPSPTKGMKFPNRPKKALPKTGAMHSSNIGAIRTPEMKERISTTLKTRNTCNDCQQEWNPTWMTRHKQVGKCIAQ